MGDGTYDILPGAEEKAHDLALKPESVEALVERSDNMIAQEARTLDILLSGNDDVCKEEPPHSSLLGMREQRDASTVGSSNVKEEVFLISSDSDGETKVPQPSLQDLGRLHCTPLEVLSSS